MRRVEGRWLWPSLPHCRIFQRRWLQELFQWDPYRRNPFVLPELSTRCCSAVPGLYPFHPVSPKRWTGWRKWNQHTTSAIHRSVAGPVRQSPLFHPLLILWIPWSLENLSSLEAPRGQELRQVHSRHSCFASRMSLYKYFPPAHGICHSSIHAEWTGRSIYNTIIRPISPKYW